ncbi:type II toxin-antitoxin system RelE/ParE family toxin [Phyllobacterium sp. UNC302MFCol5.2]|uniref:type II toxin-antitoxin system RelE/ParE family toxin n=1 Tax=Phyllobacterium sp. UNC302MFCol5.2 TaxID=1449065 RepID=UPI0004850489|nr:type II toxin-antitoxin system RelE/ParE family toxin [Phyllobacterium sp. UNC302MFCol5.2]
MIRTFKSKALATLWRTGKSTIEPRMHKRILVRLDTLDKAVMAEELNLPGYNFHALRGFNPKRCTIHVNGPWCITFEFKDGDAQAVDFEQYH